MAVSLLAKLMNSMVVSLVSEQTHGKAEWKSIVIWITIMLIILLVASMVVLEGYCAFHRLLLMFVKQFPDLITQIDQKIEDFITKHACRHKSVLTFVCLVITITNSFTSTYLRLENFYHCWQFPNFSGKMSPKLILRKASTVMCAGC